MTLRAIDALCTRGVLAVDAIAARGPWRLGRWLHAAARSVHEGVLAGGRRLGVSYVPEAWIERSAAGEAPAIPRRYPAPVPLADEAAAHLASLRDGTWRPDAGAPFDLGTCVWSAAEDEGHSMQVRFLWHLLHPVAVLLAAHDDRGDAEDLARALDLARRWIRSCLFRERAESVWDDHITAMRALVLCDLWAALRRAPGSRAEPLAPLGEALARHAERLSLPRFYRPEHNHGVTQAYALLALASALRAHPHAARWRRRAGSWLEAQMEENVSAEGVHREHSPYYHFFVLRQFAGAARLARAEGHPRSGAYHARLDRMLEAGASMIRPDGSLAPLGDTWHGAPILLSDGDLEPFAPDVAERFRAARTADAGAAPAASAIFPGGGLAVIRSGRGEGEKARDERYLAVRLEVFSTSHVHADALALTLWGYGADLLVDSGGPYGYGEEWRRRYFTTTAAHNTVVVDSLRQAPGPCRVHRWESRPGCQELDAEHENYPGVRHRRSIALFRGRYLFVIDRLSSATPHRYRQCFHFAPDLRVETSGQEVVAFRGGDGPSLRLVPLLARERTPELHHGGDDPAGGWITTGDLERRPTWTAQFEAEGAEALFATLIVPAPGPRPPEVRVRETEGAGVAVELEGLPMRLDLRPDASASVMEATR